MQDSLLTKVGLPLALFIIMLGMGLALKVDDFKRVFKFPKAVAVGLLSQMLLLPVLGFAVVKLVDMGDPELAVGLMVLTFCPGGTTSNMLTFLARGDVALSITLTAIVSALAPFTIPFLTNASMDSLMGAGQVIKMPLGQTVGLLLGITALPIAIGMAIHKKWPNASKKADKPVKILSVVVLAVIIAALVLKFRENIMGWFAAAGVAALVLNVLAMGCGFGIARLSGLKRDQQITVSMEVGIQNGTTALLVTGTLLGVEKMMIAPAVYSLIMFATGGLFGYLINLGRKNEDPAPEAA